MWENTSTAVKEDYTAYFSFVRHYIIPYTIMVSTFSQNRKTFSLSINGYLGNRNKCPMFISIFRNKFG